MGGEIKMSFLCYTSWFHGVRREQRGVRVTNVNKLSDHTDLTLVKQIANAAI